MSFPLEFLYESELLSPLDYHFTRTLSELSGEKNPHALAALALCSRQTRAGHVCVALQAMADTPIVTEAGEPLVHDGTALRWPVLSAWIDSLRSSPLVSYGERRSPLVLDAAHRLYLYRYWEHEQRVAECLRARLSPAQGDIDGKLLREGLRRLFGPSDGHPAQDPAQAPAQGPAQGAAQGPTQGGAQRDAQRDAALLAVTGRFCTISGGPGTGKTFTVAKILALLTEQSLAHHGRGSTSLLVAPTGKAAARLVDSIRAAKAKLDCSEEVKNAITETASTIHRALGSRRGSATRFYHDREHPLSADLVLVDEASMVDVALMRRLLEAVPDEARLILLGDRHQLASVEAGSVLADLCGSGEHPGYSDSVVTRVKELTGHTLPLRSASGSAILDSVVELTQSYRFSQDSAIARFAQAVKQGQSDAAAALLAPSSNPASASSEELALVTGGNSDPEALLRQLERHVVERMRQFTEVDDPVRALRQLDEFRVLCAHRKGPLGVELINQRLEAALQRAGLIDKNTEWYVKRPILITQNDHQLRLFNGDVGLILRDASGALRAFFDAGAGQTRALSPARLPSHETVYAMSIHKSQGSEFSEVAIVLPRADSPLLTRELLYTAVTRARRRAVLYGDIESIQTGVARPVARASGLGQLLHGR